MTVGKSDRRHRLVLTTVIVAAVFMSNLDLWIVNVALFDVARGFGSTLSDVSWVLNAYAVTLAALLIPAGRWGDRIGQRQVFLLGVAVFTLASVACAFAPTLGVLVLARIVQAAGAAAQLPTSLALLMAGVAPAARLKAARGWAAVGAVSAVCGPVFGGLLVALSWRWVFIVNLPIGLAAWWIGRRVLPRSTARDREPAPDLGGGVLLVVAVAALTGALVQAPDWGWGSGRTLGLLAVAAVGTAGFVHRGLRHERPTVELHLLAVRPFALANAATFAFGAAFAIMLLSNSLWCQDVWHYSALRTGLALAPGPAMVPPTTIASARLVRRIGPGRMAAIGCALFAVGMMWRVWQAGADPDYVSDLLPSSLISGTGVGLALGTLIASAATALPGHRAATASAFVNSVRQVASALGVAVLVTLLTEHVGTATVRGFDLGWYVAAALALVAGAVALALPRSAGSADEATAGRFGTDTRAATVAADASGTIGA